MSEPQPSSVKPDRHDTSTDPRHVIVARFMFNSHAEAAHAANVLDGLCLPGLLAAELIIEEV